MSHVLFYICENACTQSAIQQFEGQAHEIAANRFTDSPVCCVCLGVCQFHSNVVFLCCAHVSIVVYDQVLIELSVFCLEKKNLKLYCI